MSVIIPCRHWYFTFKRQKLQKEQAKIDGTFLWHKKISTATMSKNEKNLEEHFKQYFKLIAIGLIL